MASFDLQGRNLIHDFWFVEADKVVYDDVGCPEMFHHVTTNIQLTLGPVS